MIRHCARTLGCLAAAAGLVPGCALNRQADQEISDLLARYERNRLPLSERYGYQQRPTPATAPSPASAPASKAATLPAAGTLAGLIAVALDHNPDIQAAVEIARSRASRIPQVTALPDPFLSTKTLPEPVRTAEGDNFFILGVKQKIPVPEKLDRRGRVALEEARMAMAELEQTRLRVIAEVKRSYYRIYVIDRTVGITEENKDLMRDLIEVARGEFAAARRPQEDVLRAQVEYSNLESELIVLRQQRLTAAAVLNALLDRPPATPVPSPGGFDVRRVDLHLERLLAHAAKDNPELRRLRQKIARDQQAVRLARLAYWPDFTLGFEWMQMDDRPAFRPRFGAPTTPKSRLNRLSEAGSDNWAITFGFNVPLWYDKIEAGIREAKRRLSASRREYVSVGNQVSFQTEDALARVRSQRNLADLFATTIIPQAKQAYEVSRDGYVTGTSDFQFLIDNWQKWLVFRILYHRALGELERSIADLERAIGISVVDLVERETKQSSAEAGSHAKE